MSTWKTGDKIRLENSGDAEVLRLIGEGGQGAVYEVKLSHGGGGGVLMPSSGITPVS